MHTSELMSCRMHYNSDYSGDLFITNKDSTSKPAGKGEKAEIRTTVEHLYSLFRIHKKSMSLDLSIPTQTVIIEGNSPDHDKEIEVLFSDLVAFFSEYWIEQINPSLYYCGYHVLEKIHGIVSEEMRKKEKKDDSKD